MPLQEESLLVARHRCLPFAMDVVQIKEGFQRRFLGHEKILVSLHQEVGRIKLQSGQCSLFQRLELTFFLQTVDYEVS